MGSNLRCLLLADFNLSNLAGLLENDERLPAVEVMETDFGQVFPILLNPDHAAWKEAPDFTVIWTLAESVSPQFAEAAAARPFDEAGILAEVDAFADLLIQAASRTKWLFVPTWSSPALLGGSGLLDWKAGTGRAYLLASMNLELAKRLAAATNVIMLETQRWISAAGPDAFSDKLWYQGKIPFSHKVFQSAVEDIKACIQNVLGHARKLIVLDLDDTLWGGIVGDVGWQGLKLGGHDAIGEAYADFQKALLCFKRRGILLAIASKNEESVALEAIRNHPEMLLKEADFCGWKINWNDKAANIVELVSSLNLGLQSVVFIDDNPVERARVREALPEVLAPDWPENPQLFKHALLSLRCFDQPQSTAEDRNRTQSYAAEKQRTDLKKHLSSPEEWLKSLDIHVNVEPLDEKNLARAAQLLNKTNQMNLATRRMADREFLDWTRQPGYEAWAFRVSDKFGDSGLTGLASLQVQDKNAKIVDFILSCRVMGRKVEETLLHWLVQRAIAWGCDSLQAQHLPTPKNAPCLEFFKRSGLNANAEDGFRWDCAQPYPLPDCIVLSKPDIIVSPPIKPGDTCDWSGRISGPDIQQFIQLSGDDSWLHADEEYARKSEYGDILAHGVHPLLFLTGLPLLQRPGHKAMFKSISANFNRPIFRNNPLKITCSVSETTASGTSFEFEIINTQSGLVSTTGLMEVAFVIEAPGAVNSGNSANHSGSLLGSTFKKGVPLSFADIQRDMERAFEFVISTSSLDLCHRILCDAGLHVDKEKWQTHCDLPTWMTTALIATFVGTQIPGGSGTCLNFDLSYAHPVPVDSPCRFSGKVNFKSPTSQSVVCALKIANAASTAEGILATGKVHAAVKPLKT